MNSESKLKRTPLFAAHVRSGGKLVEFGGWEMPVQYTSISEEHLNVRKAAGIFDISHMGEFLVSGAGAEAFLNANLTNDVRKLEPGTGQYTLICNQRGGVVDDLYVYRLGPAEYLLIVNASRIQDDLAWLNGRLAQGAEGEVQLRDISGETGAVAVQGPQVRGFIDECFEGPAAGGTRADAVAALKKNQAAQMRFSGRPVWVACTGYTGEDGFEVVAPAEMIESIWEELLRVGAEFGLKPAGLGARDTLRTEMCYPLYGHELTEETTPLEAGLGFFVSLDKGDFIGREVMIEQKSRGVVRKLAAFKMAERSAPPRPGYPIWSGSERVGVVASGTQSPSLNVGIGMAYLPGSVAQPGTAVQVEIRGRKCPAVIVPKPIYRKPGKS